MNGALASGSRQATEAGVLVFESGGNAADAAIAGVFASMASECVFTNPGAGGVAIVRQPDGAVIALDFFSAMPGLGATRELHRGELDFREVSIQFGKAALSFHIGRGSVAVPGVLKGLAHLHRRFGRLPFRELLQPAIALARDGFEASPQIVDIGRILEPIMRDTPDMYAAFGGPDAYFATPERMTLPPLADLLSTVADEGPESFYTGAAAEMIVKDQHERGGLITAEDLARYAVLELEPLRVRLGRGRMFTLPPPSLGGSMVVVILRLWRALEQQFGKPELQSLDFIHRWAVVLQAVNKTRRLVDEVRAAPDPDHFIDAVVESLRQIAAPAVRERRPLGQIQMPRVPGNTTHYSAVDGSGMAVSITTSPGESAGFLVPGLNMMMNNMLGEDDLFTAGFHTEKAGMRLPTMMAPSILQMPHDSDTPDTYVFGSGGSIRIRTALSEFVYFLADEGLSMRQCVHEPRVHIEKEILHIESQRDPALIEQLGAMGYRVDEWAERSAFFGGVHAVCLTAAGELLAEADPRRGGCGRVVG